MSNHLTIGMMALTLAAGVAGAQGTPPIRTLLLTEHSNHNWQYTSSLNAETLEATGRFAVTISDDPAGALAAGGAYQLFVIDYNDLKEPRRWGDAAEKRFTDAVRAGAGVAAIHSATNSFKGWEDYERMVGLLWRDGAGHGPFHTFDVTYDDAANPITKGLAAITGHGDELYHGLTEAKGATVHVLATAMSATDAGGSGKREPMAWTTTFDKGRVFVTALGHVWSGEETTKSTITDPAFKALLSRGAEWAATGAVTLPAAWADIRTHNTLTPAEASEGWTLLFDGQASAMRGFKKEAMPTEGWQVENGTLRHVAGSGGGDIVTPLEYADFEFACDWKVAPGANSGIIYRCTEDHQYPWETGPEMQILDDARHADGKSPLTRAGTLYALVPLAADVARPAGEWNHARVVMHGTRVEHWLNGVKVVDNDFAGEAYKMAHAASKFTKMPDFATRAKGHIALQDHGDDVWFRNVKVRALK